MISGENAGPEAVVTGEALIDEDAVAAFASAVNDANPRYRQGLAVPLLFTAGLVLPAYQTAHRAWLDTVDVRDYSLGVHGQHDVYFFGQVVPGTRCRWSVGPRSAIRTKGGALVTVSALITDLVGAPLVEHLWSTFYLGGRIGTEVGEPLPDHSFPGIERDSPYRTRVVPIDRDQGFRYGGATGDRSAHSINDDWARDEGYPGKILQGMCTFSMVSGALLDLLADGDPARVERIAVRFSAPTRPRGELTVNAFEAGLSEKRGHVFAFEAHQAGSPVLRHGRIELRN